MDERMDRRIARLALDRFRVSGFVGTSIADLAGALGVPRPPSTTTTDPRTRCCTA
jgi:AcrR family transcriptional regulator